MKYRLILLLTLMSLLALPLSGITTAQETSKYSESPMLAERVAAGSTGAIQISPPLIVCLVTCPSACRMLTFIASRP